LGSGDRRAPVICQSPFKSGPSELRLAVKMKYYGFASNLPWVRLWVR